MSALYCFHGVIKTWNLKIRRYEAHFNPFTILVTKAMVICYFQRPHATWTKKSLKLTQIGGHVMLDFQIYRFSSYLK